MPPETPRPENFEELRFRPPEPRIATTAELKKTRLGRYAEIGPRVVLREVEVGDFSYFERGGEAVLILRRHQPAGGSRNHHFARAIDIVTDHRFAGE